MLRISSSRKAWFTRARYVYVGGRTTLIDMGTLVTVCTGNYKRLVKVNIKGKFAYIPYFYISFDMDHYEVLIKPKIIVGTALAKEECPNCKSKLSLTHYTKKHTIVKSTLYECPSCDTIIINDLIIKGTK